MPRKTEDYIRLDAPGEANKHEGHKIRTRTFSKKDGIKALYCVDCKKHTAYLFSGKPPWSWTMSRAQAWLKKRKKASFADLSESGEIIFEHFDEKGVLVETVDQEKLKQETEKMNFDKELREDRTIFLFGHIDEWTAEDICKRLLVYDKLDPVKPVKLYISSFGGSVYASFAIIDMMESVKCPTEVVGIGKIMSGGLLIFMAGDKRYISQTASILSHRFSGMRMGTQAELKADRRNEELIHQRMIDHYIKFSNLEDKKEVEAKLLQETNVWLTPEEALEYELADDYFDKDWDEEERVTEAIQESVFGESYEHKLGGYGYILNGTPTEKYGSPQSEFGYYPSVQRISEIYFLLDRLAEVKIAGEASVGILQKLKGILKHWTGQAFPVPEEYWLPDEVEDVEDFEEIHSVLDKLIASDSDYKGVLQEMKAILTRIVQGDFFYPRLHSSIEEVRKVRVGDGFMNESVTVDWIEEDSSKPFRFTGKAVKIDRRNDNNRRYKRKITERALKESQRLADKGQVLTIMSGHPKIGDTDPSKIVGKVTFGDIDVEGWMPYEAQLSNTSLGMDLQKLLRDKCIGDVSLRSRGRTAVVKVDGESVEDVTDLHFKGLDLVIAGSEEGAGVDAILNAGKKKSVKTPPAFKGEMGGEFEMGTTLVELKKDCPELVETIRTEEKEKLNTKIEKLKTEQKESKIKLEEAEGKLKEAEDAGNVTIEDHKKLKEEVVDLKAKNKLRESKEVYLQKIKEAKLTPEMTEGLEEQCLGKKSEEMDKKIKARIEFVQRISKTETIGLIEKKEDKEDPEKKKERIDKDVKEAF